MKCVIRREKLGDQDSNLNKQNQNLLCYRYTIPQWERNAMYSAAGGGVKRCYSACVCVGPVGEVAKRIVVVFPRWYHR